MDEGMNMTSEDGDGDLIDVADKDLISMVGEEPPLYQDFVNIEKDQTAETTATTEMVNSATGYGEELEMLLMIDKNFCFC